MNLDYPTDCHNYWRFHFKNTGLSFCCFFIPCFSEVALAFFSYQKRGLNPCFCAGGFNVTSFLTGETERNIQGSDQNTNKSHQLTISTDYDNGVSSMSVAGRVGGRGRTTETNMAVSFTVYSSTPETWYKAIGFCLLGLSFHSSHRSGV